MDKTYSVQEGIGMARYVINFNDGVKKHKDGSIFRDVRIFSNMRGRDKFIAQLKSDGYVTH